jgi:hypothetical protein
MIREGDLTMYDTGIDFKNTERELILSKLSETIDYLHHKCLKGNVRNESHEKVRIQWFKAFSYSCSIYNQISRDHELDELKQDIEELKKHINDDLK